MNTLKSSQLSKALKQLSRIAKEGNNVTFSHEHASASDKDNYYVIYTDIGLNISVAHHGGHRLLDSFLSWHVIETEEQYLWCSGYVLSMEQAVDCAIFIMDFIDEKCIVEITTSVVEEFAPHALDAGTPVYQKSLVPERSKILDEESTTDAIVHPIVSDPTLRDWFDPTGALSDEELSIIIQSGMEDS